jgi:hypothetical protein
VASRRPRSRPFSLTRLASPLLVAVAAACAQTFTPSNAVESVRILAIRADLPYAPPGAAVTLDLLAVDGRASKPAPMTVRWVEQPCVNPPNDDYYACFSSFGSQFPQGVDLTSELASGTSFTLTLPATIISAHANTSGGDPYGVAFVFAMACAGHVEYRGTSRATPDAVPFGCFDSTGRALGPDAFVFSYARVYSFSRRTNANPVIDHLTFGGATVDPAAGVTVQECTASSPTDCSATPLDTIVPASSQEEDPGTLDASGHPLREEIWVDYYATGTQLANDAEVLYDPLTGAVAGSGDGLYAPRSAGTQQIWAVAHDNRGGVSWLAIPLHTL